MITEHLRGTDNCVIHKPSLCPHVPFHTICQFRQSRRFRLWCIDSVTNEEEQNVQSRLAFLNRIPSRDSGLKPSLWTSAFESLQKMFCATELKHASWMNCSRGSPCKATCSTSSPTTCHLVWKGVWFLIGEKWRRSRLGGWILWPD